MFIEQHNPVGRLERFQQQVGLLFFLLLFRQAFRVLQFRNDFDVEGQIVPYAFGIFLDSGNEVRVVGLSYNKQGNFHGDGFFIFF